MGRWYNPKRTRNIYNPVSSDSHRLSRSKIDLFVECPRCFYLDQRLGVGRPPSYPFNLNNAVDTLLKREFDVYREKQKPHPLMEQYKIDAVPYKHQKLEEWRDALRRGITYHHTPTNLTFRGGIDDVWVDTKGILYIVDYKATSKKEEVTLDADWQDGYKRQMEIYQWLFRKNDFSVSDTGYFVYVNGDADKEEFGGRLEFDMKIIPYTGSDAWIEDVLTHLHACLQSEIIPQKGKDCDFCSYRESAGKSLLEIHTKSAKSKVAEKIPDTKVEKSKTAQLF